MGKNDKFANIAAGGIQTENKSLRKPEIRRPTKNHLHLEYVAKPTLFDIEEDMEATLRQQMEDLKTQYAPFMQRLSPKIRNCRKILTFDQFQWREISQADRSDFSRVSSGEGPWELVKIPHYGGPLGKAETIYRHTFTLEQLPSPKQSAWLRFRGVDYIAHVYLNGKLLGTHEGFFAPFEFDCTDYLQSNENVLVICVKNDYVHQGNPLTYGGKEYNGDKIYAATGPGYDDPDMGWHHCPPGMGIYQAVELELRPQQFVSDLFVRPLPEQAAAEVWIEAYDCWLEERSIRFALSVYGRNFEATIEEDLLCVPQTGRATGLGDTFTQAQLISQGLLDKPIELTLQNGINYFRFTVPMGNFRWWSCEHPWLYEAQVKLLDECGELLDMDAVSFGMRTFVIDETQRIKGMPYLNRKKCRLRGANTMGFEQQDVINGDFDQLVEDILFAKACNMNFLRLTQRPVQDEVYDYCDMLGMMTQTDLPLFGVLRRNQFAEAARQAGEMERLIRKHPCNVLISYINEPFPNAGNLPQRHLDRNELVSFFEVADRMVHLNNPDRAIKYVDGDYDPPSVKLPDNHCYTCWYNGHGLDAGELHKGNWIPVNRGWYYGCGEFGAEGLDPVDLMRRRYPTAWLPQTPEEEAKWTPNSIIGSQTGSFHYFFYETPHTLEEWCHRSLEYQAEATRWMMEAFRRNREMVSSAIHLFIDAFPSGWMKSIIDVERRPKPAFFAYRDALTPTMVSLRTDRFNYFPGDKGKVEIWLCNDKPEDIPATVIYEVLQSDDTVLQGKMEITISESDVQYGGLLVFPMAKTPGETIVRCVVMDNRGNALHQNTLKLRTIEKETNHKPQLIALSCNGPAARLVSMLGNTVLDSDKVSCILVDNYEDYDKRRKDLDELVKKGKKLVFMELPTGEYLLCGKTVSIKDSSMMPMHFVSRDTCHPWVAGFDRKDFRHWYNRKLDRITPILESTFTNPEITPVLTSGNTNDAGQWETTQAVGTWEYGAGQVVLCQLKLASHVADEPVAWNFAQRMLEEREIGQ